MFLYHLLVDVMNSIYHPTLSTSSAPYILLVVGWVLICCMLVYIMNAPTHMLARMERCQKYFYHCNSDSAMPFDGAGADLTSHHANN